MASIYQQLIARVEELATYIGNELQLRGFKRGGSVGQVPVKSGAGDFDWAWGDVSGTGGGSVAWDDVTDKPLIFPPDLSNVDNIQFDLTPTSDTFSIGETKWNAAEGCLSYGVLGGDISIGKEIWENYHDLDGDMVDGDVVSVVGASGNRSAVRKTNATSATSAAAVLGMVTNVNGDGTVRVTEFGRVHKLNTNGYSEGAMIYVNPAANGKWTTTKPTSPNYAVEVGVIEVAHSVNGVVGVRCRSVTFPSANIIDLSSATVGALFNGTISGTLAVNSTSFTFGTGSAVAFFAKLVDGNESTARTELGATTIGDELFTAASIAAARSTLGEQTITLGTAVTYTTTTTLTDTIGPFTVEANTTYKVEWMVPYTCATAVEGVQMQFKLATAANSPGDGAGYGVSNRGGLAVQNISWSTSGTIAQLGATTTIAAGAFSGYLYFTTGASSGTLWLQTAKNSAGAGANTVISARATATLKKY